MKSENNENFELSKIMKRLTEFPSSASIDLVDKQNQKASLFSILERVSNSENVYFKLVTAKVQEMCNTLTAAGSLSQKSFQS
jgi:hypothetical protein